VGSEVHPAMNYRQLTRRLRQLGIDPDLFYERPKGQ
jgi:hypothetical protein